MQLTRIFHAVGQGAFYTERLSVGQKSFNIVYDCGSVTLKDKKMRTMVNASFLKDEVIDLLFISHFHADHISGIQALRDQCEIKQVIIPYLSEKAKALVRIANALEDNYLDTGLIDDPTTFFDATTRIIIINDQNDKSDINDNNLLLLPEEDGLRVKQVPGGTRIQLRQIREWLFIPFNYQQDTKLKAFENALAKIPLEIKDIRTVTDIIAHKPEITKAYVSLFGDLNESSLMLYSGPVNTMALVNHVHRYYLNFWPWDRAEDAGCLYLGDINLNQSGIVTSIKNTYLQVWSKVSTLQVPHHGAIKNFNEGLFEKNKAKFAIFSYGTNNAYGHPSARVIGELRLQQMVPLLVTEQLDSLFIQTCEEAHN